MHKRTHRALATAPGCGRLSLFSGIRKQRLREAESPPAGRTAGEGLTRGSEAGLRGHNCLASPCAPQANKRSGRGQAQWARPPSPPPTPAPAFYLLGSCGLPRASLRPPPSLSFLLHHWSLAEFSLCLSSLTISHCLSPHLGPWPSVRNRSPLFLRWTLRLGGGFATPTSGGRPDLSEVPSSTHQRPGGLSPSPQGGSGFVSGPGPRMAKRSRLGDVSL